MFRAGTECIKAEEGGYQEENGAGDEDYRIGGGVRLTSSMRTPKFIRE